MMKMKVVGIIMLTPLKKISSRRNLASTVSRRIEAMFSKHGESDYIGEPVSITAHSLQAAALASQNYGDDKEFIVSGLLHDIGHLVGIEAGQSMEMDGCGVADHESLGASFLSDLGFTERVQKFVASHVKAKRYLCFAQDGYHASLSEASKTTLKFQGGVMSASEARAFENDVDFQKMLSLRSFDEAAKVAGLPVPPLDAYRQLLDATSMMVPNGTVAQDDDFPTYILSSAQRNFWNQHGFLKISNLLSFTDTSVSSVSRWVDEISAWPRTDGKWLQHWELAGGDDNGTKLLCRTENFVDYHVEMRRLCRGPLLAVVSQLFGEPAVLFKEKINYKHPGGAGFAAHQDSPAYIGLATDHISVMVAVDPSTPSNGCLELAAGVWREGEVPLTPSGIITPEGERSMRFDRVPCEAGDVLLFAGYTPHRSGANTSPLSRRALFLTYNPSSQGDHHAQYYRAKHAGSHGFDGAKTISFQGDFQGRIVD